MFLKTDMTKMRKSIFFFYFTISEHPINLKRYLHGPLPNQTKQGKQEKKNCLHPIFGGLQVFLTIGFVDPICAY